MEYAHELLDDLHPLRNTPICKAFPWMGIFTLCGVPDYPQPIQNQEAKANSQVMMESASADQIDAPLLSKKTTMIVNGREVVKRTKRKPKSAIGDKAKLEAEPLAVLGFGIVNYTDILWTLIVVFFVFSLMLVPSMRIYHQGTGYLHVAEKLKQYEKGMIGNLGYSSMQCSSVPV